MGGKVRVMCERCGRADHLAAKEVKNLAGHMQKHPTGYFTCRYCMRAMVGLKTAGPGIVMERQHAPS